MLDALGPAQVADVDQSIDAVFDLDERAEVGQVANAAFNRARPPGYLSCKLSHGFVASCRMPSEMRRSVRIDAEHDAFHLVADIDQLRRMLHPLGPGHLADVDQAFDALLQLHERAVVGHADDAPADVCADGIALLRIEPRIRRQLLESQRDALLVLVELQNLDLDLIADIHQVTRMRQPSPRHIGDVQQAIEAAHIDECAVVGQVLHHASEDCAFFQVLESLAALLRVLLLFQQLLARNHDVAALLVQLDDGDFDLWPFMPSRLRTGRSSTCEPGRKAARRNVDRQAALDAIDHDGINWLLFVVRASPFHPMRAAAGPSGARG